MRSEKRNFASGKRITTLGAKKNALYLNVKVFTSTKILIDDTIFTSPTGEGTVILRAHLSHVNV